MNIYLGLLVSPRLLAAVCFIAGSCCLLNAQPGPIPGTEDIRELMGKSSLVCKGEILNVTRRDVRFRADRCFKDKTETNPIYVVFAPAFVPSMTKGEYVLLFLSHSGSNYIPTDPYFQKFAISPQLPPVPEDITDAMRRLEVDIAATLPSENEEIRVGEIELLGNMKTLLSTKPLLDLLPAADDRVRGSIYLALLKLSDYSMLGPTGKFLELRRVDPRIQRVQAQINQVIGSIHDIPDSRTLQQLETFSQSEEPSLRRAAVRALRTIQNPESAPFLVARLDDSARETRYDALMALARLEGKGVGWAPSYDLFQREPGKYINRWKKWWHDEGKQKYSPKK